MKIPDLASILGLFVIIPDNCKDRAALVAYRSKKTGV